MSNLWRPDQVEGHLPNLKNLLINGGFEIWQRGPGPFFGTLLTNEYTADEWMTSQTAGLATVVRDAGKSGQYGIKATPTGGATGVLEQSIEFYKELEGQTVTFSAWVKASVANSVFISINDFTTVWEGAGSSAHSGSGEWERITVTKKIRSGLGAAPISGGPPHGYPLYVAFGGFVEFVADSASLVVGNFPQGVPFIPVHPADDWNRCLRFYWKSVNNWYGAHTMTSAPGDQDIVTYPFPVRMAKVPVIALSNIILTPIATGVTATPNDETSWNLLMTTAGVGPRLKYGEVQYDIEAVVA